MTPMPTEIPLSGKYSRLTVIQRFVLFCMNMIMTLNRITVSEQQRKFHINSEKSTTRKAGAVCMISKITGIVISMSHVNLRATGHRMMIQLRKTVFMTSVWKPTVQCFRQENMSRLIRKSSSTATAKKYGIISI